MPITIECSGCHRSYRLDDKLAGQRVRCRDCGAAIDIPGAAPAAPADPAGAGDGGPGVPDLRSLFGAPGQPRAAAQADVNFLDPASLPRRKRRWVRTSGSPMLDSLDPLIKAACVLILLGAIAIWVIHIYQTPAGISFSTLLPMIVVLAVIAGVIAPLMTMSINAAVRMIKLAPRDDAYGRIACALLLPFSGAMIAGFPGAVGGSLGVVPFAAWFICPFLLIYFFRAELFEWTVSISAAIVALGLGMVGAALVGTLVAAINGPLYRDMLPPGPWTGMAGAHSPIPPPPPPAPPPTTLASAPAAEQGSFGKPQESASAPAGSASQVAATKPAIAPGGNNGAPGRAAASRDIHSPFLVDVIPEEASLTEINRVIAPSVPTGGMVIVKNVGNQSTVEKWDANPPADVADLTFPYFPKKPNAYALSPRNDDLVALCFFPRSEIDIFAFDGKTPRKTIPLEVPDAAPSLLGYSDPTHFLVRWDQEPAAGMAKVQTWSLPAGQPQHMTAAIPTLPGEASMVLAPGGKTLAVCESGAQLALYSVDSGAQLRKIRLTDLPFSLVAMAFSPDASQIAVYGLISDVPTILSFKTQTGAPVATSILAASWTRPADDPMKHRLLWLQTRQGDDLWLVNGCDFLDPASGKKIGSLTVKDVLDVQPIGAGSLIFELPGSAEDTENAVVARLDDKALHEALAKGH